MTETETRELADDQLTALTQLEELLDDLANDREVYDYQVREGVEAVETAQEHTAEMLDRASMRETDRVVLDLEEARRVANSLEMLYYDTKESAYDATDEQAALDAMAIRERGGIEPNPELLEQPADTDGETDG
jgi:hypothetical protein